MIRISLLRGGSITIRFETTITAAGEGHLDLDQPPNIFSIFFLFAGLGRFDRPALTVLIRYHIIFRETGRQNPPAGNGHFPENPHNPMGDGWRKPVTNFSGCDTNNRKNQIPVGEQQWSNAEFAFIITSLRNFCGIPGWGRRQGRCLPGRRACGAVAAVCHG